ncbi:phosphoribosyl-dephospho-CoA transferase [Noviherbaspirillum humi]|uniref:Phosphoribosyl-dephospho-CoA transferase n=1 Tax=Noviherbaspirillum humi TaxID=1688639 RepID=A0A239KZF7_9BURK|nr:malonate decarboxylase holo-[acyl-carrier-protein] synthase [Noviherbaspirillum humi]SNT23716.1 phosphoribosyl-dephospho-CoA transferase [Noviherbaspirillum humi]
MMASLARHDLLWLTGVGWARAIDGLSGPAREAALRWRERDWPVVARRRDADAADDELCGGIALPPQADGSKPRIALRAPLSALDRRCGALPLSAVIDKAPPAWQQKLSLLEEQARDAGIGLRVFGSLSWQALTGQAYVTPASDIDLLCRPADRSALESACILYETGSMQLPLDGELIFPSGAAVSWKEWMVARKAGSSCLRVLVKQAHTVRLALPAELLAELPAEMASA